MLSYPLNVLQSFYLFVHKVTAFSAEMRSFLSKRMGKICYEWRAYGEELAVESGERERGRDVELHLRPEWSAVCDGALASQAQLLIFFVDGLYLLFGEFHLVFQALHFAVHLFNEAVSFAAAAVEKAQIVFVGDDLLL